MNTQSTGKSTNSWTRELPAEWEHRPLPDLVSEIIDNRGRTAPTAGSGIPLIATNCIKNDGLYPTYEKVRFVSEETYKTWFRGHPKPGDIIFVNKGSPGSTCLVPDPVDFCIAQDMVALRPNREIVDGEYLLAALRSPDALAQIQAFNVGTIIPHLKKTDFPKLLLPLPPRPMQEFIGRLYCDLSRKIELNRHINQTLEAMAQALYKHWFVDFGPFRGGEFMDSELGLIPQGWEVQTLESVCAVNTRTLTSNNAPQFIRYVDISSVSVGNVTETKEMAFADAPSRARRIVQDGDTVWSMVRPERKSYFLALTPLENTIVSTGFAVVSPRQISWSWVYLTLTTDDFVAYLTSNATGAAYPAVTSSVFSKAKIILPPRPVLDSFHNQTETWFRQIVANSQEDQTLTRARDYLLPKLLSGEIEANITDLNQEGVL